MATRVFEIARQLGVKSKAILEKCKAEGVPNMNNHMSSVSAGLEATIREWFSDASAGGTSVETTEHVNLEKVRAKPRRKKARAKAAHAADDTQPDAATVATAVAPAPAGPSAITPVVAPSAPAPAEPATADTTETGVKDNGVEAPEAGAPATIAATSTPADTPTDTDTASAVAPSAPAPPRVRMNKPERPKEIRPAGPKLETQKPATLSGPKVVRIEAPEVIDRPRPRSAGGPSRGPRTSGGGGVFGPNDPSSRAGGGVGGGGGGADSSRRNKRRRGGPGSTKGAPRKEGDNAGGSRWRPQDLAEREARLSRAGGFIRQRRRDMKVKRRAPSFHAQSAAEQGGKVQIAAPFTIKDLSSATGVKSSEIIKQLFLEGVMATVNSGIDPAKAQELMIEYDIELEVTEARTAEQAVQEEFAERETINERPRDPVVTILGHVDHGKTSLLDRIRSAHVAEGEAGGITQATSAFRVPVHLGDESKHLVFFDTPGHEAFTAMRARGAQVTDIVVLVVAADDGVMPQTVESIDHAQAAGVPIIVALNKIDKPEATDANIQRILGQLAEHGLNPTEWGGETEVVKTSAVKNEGVDDLLETIDLQAQVLELTADFGGPARGTVIESAMVEGKGPTASVLVQDGQLKIGDFIVAGRAFGRVRDIVNDRGAPMKSSGPATPVRISGLDELPNAGDKFYAVDSLRKAQDAAEQRRQRERELELAQPKVTLETMLSQMKEQEVHELRVVIKADVQGSVDVLRKTAEDISTDEVRVRVLHAAVGGVTESDILLADASDAVIIGFNVIASAKARQLAERKRVQIRLYQVIYDIADDLKKAAEGLLEPDIREEVLGHAEVRKVFKVSKVGSVAGCYVTDGVIERNALIRVTRDDIVTEHDRVLSQLKRFKDDAKEVRSGQECGMKINGYDDIKEGDILECYRKVEVKRTL